MDMEISAGNITGGRDSPPPLNPHSVTTNGSHIVNNLNKITEGHPLEDRGVDLSFDVKKETETEIKTENCDIIKKEFKNSEDCGASMLQSPGGRLKIYKDGKLLIDLKADGDKGRWVTSSSSRVYWPPPASLTARIDSTASQHTITGSEGSVENSSVHSPGGSPWRSQPSPRPSPLPSSLSPTSHRVKPVPRKCHNPPRELVFFMRPPQGIRDYRKKIRKKIEKKCRNPSSEIKINPFIIKIEINAAQGKPFKKVQRPNIQSNVRFGRCQAQLERLRKLRDRVHVPIQAWKSGRTDLRDLVKGPASPYLPPRVKTETGGMKIKSELKMVTETCTATVTSVTSSPKAQTKVKAETRVVTAETRPVPVRTLPITPTVARVKQELPAGLKTASTAIMSPELARVKMEIGPNNPHGFLERMRDERDGAFVSPRKRLMRDMRDFENSSPSAKNRRLSNEHRLSTDSLGSTSDRSSPYRAPHSPHRGAMSPGLAMSPRPGAKVSNFSIDSIMGGGAGPQMPRQPATPGKVSQGGRSGPSLPLAPTPTRPQPASARGSSPPPVAAPYSPYLYPGLHPLLAGDPRLLDHRLAQLAGLAQLQAQVSPLTAGPDPRLSPHFLLNPGAYMAAAAASSPLSSLLSQAAASQQSGVWTPPVATTAITTPSPTPPPVPPARQSSPPPSQPSPCLPPPTAPASDLLRHPQPGRKAPDIQYRGEPARCSKLFGDNDDAPLNLSMKPTTL